MSTPTLTLVSTPEPSPETAAALRDKLALAEQSFGDLLAAEGEGERSPPRTWSAPRRPAGPWLRASTWARSGRLPAVGTRLTDYVPTDRDARDLGPVVGVPIRPENRERYPPDWKHISARIRFERAEGRCECEGECRRAHDGRCTAVHATALPGASGSKVGLTVAHLDHTPENCAETNLKAMCQACHLSYDAEHHAETAARTREAERAKWMTPLFPLPVVSAG